MKKGFVVLFLSGLFTLTIPAVLLADSSQVIQLTGEYLYLNHYKIAQKKIKENVFANTPQGKKHLEDLKGQGFTCVYKMNSIYECDQFAAPEEKNEKIEELLSLEYKDRPLYFPKVQLSIEQTNDSEYLQEFVINNSVSYGDFSVDHYSYQILKDNLHKISFVNPADDEKFYFNIVDTNVVQVPKLFTFQSGNVSTTYFVLVDYDHQCCPIND